MLLALDLKIGLNLVNFEMIPNSDVEEGGKSLGLSLFWQQRHLMFMMRVWVWMCCHLSN